MGARSRAHQQKKHQQRTSGVMVAHQDQEPLGRAALFDAAHTGTLKPTGATSRSTSSASLPRRRRTSRVGGLVTVATVLKTGAILAAAFYFLEGALLVCALSIGGLLLLVRAASATEVNRPNRMWTLTQFETFGALRVDDYVRFLVTKLAVLWRSIITLQKHAVNYSFTVSATPSVAELEDCLESRVPLMLTYDDVNATHEEKNRSRGSSIASSAVTEDCFPMLVDLEAAIAHDDEEMEVEEIEEYFAVDIHDNYNYEEVEEEYNAIDDNLCWEVEAEPPVVEESEELEVVKTTLLTDEKLKVAALRSILVPVLPLAPLLFNVNARRPDAHATRSKVPLEPTVVPMVKPLIHEVKQVKWEVDPELVPAAPAKPALKRRISIHMAPTKPLPRLVVKARPSTLTPPENVQRMLAQVERMMREVHELLAVGNEVLGYNDDETCSSKKNVRFSESVQLIQAASPLDVESEEEDEEDLRSSLHYLPEEIELMSNEYFTTAADTDDPIPTC